MRKLGSFLVYLLAFAVILAMAGFFYGYWVVSGDRNLSYVYIGDVNVSGLTRDETEALMRSRGWGDKAETPLVVTSFRGERFQVDPVRAGVALPLDKLVDKAYAVGHDSDIISNIQTAAYVYEHAIDVSREGRAVDVAYIDSLGSRR